MFHTQKDADRIAAPSQLFWYVERRRGNQRRKKNFFSHWPFLPQDQDGYNRREERFITFFYLTRSGLNRPPPLHVVQQLFETDMKAGSCRDCKYPLPLL